MARRLFSLRSSGAFMGSNRFFASHRPTTSPPYQRIGEAKVCLQFGNEAAMLNHNCFDARLIQGSLNDDRIQRLLRVAAFPLNLTGNRYWHADIVKEEIEQLSLGD